MTPGAAIGWDFARRHRWGFAGIALYLLAVAIVRVVMRARGIAPHVEFGEAFAFTVLVPLTSAFVYMLTVFTFGLSADIAGRPSIYPSRLFTLPVTTSALAGWPMAYGGAATLLLWVIVRPLAPWPSGESVPVAWPAILCATVLGWTQAFTWMPYGLRGVRVVVAITCLVGIDTVMLIGLHFRTPEWVMLAFLLPQFPLAYFVARVAVARARRGEAPDWSGVFSSARATGAAARRTRNFATPMRAQLWLEWRQHGRRLPVIVAILVPCELALLWFARFTTPAYVLYVLIGVLVTPPFVATFVGGGLRRSSGTEDTPALSRFVAVRPLTDAQIVAAKLTSATASTVAAWLVVMVMVPLGLQVFDAWGPLAALRRDWSDGIGDLRTLVVPVIAVAWLAILTWKQLVQGLYVGLSGRDWLIRGAAFATLALLFSLGPLLEWLSRSSGARGTAWDAIPLLVATLVLLKMTASVIVAIRLHRSALVGDVALIAIAAAWCVTVLALYGFFAWLLSSPFFPRYLLALFAILAIPLARVSASPLALSWNRHR